MPGLSHRAHPYAEARIARAAYGKGNGSRSSTQDINCEHNVQEEVNNSTRASRATSSTWAALGPSSLPSASLSLDPRMCSCLEQTEGWTQDIQTGVYADYRRADSDTNQEGSFFFNLPDGVREYENWTLRDSAKASPAEAKWLCEDTFAPESASRDPAPLLTTDAKNHNPLVAYNTSEEPPTLYTLHDHATPSPRIISDGMLQVVLRGRDISSAGSFVCCWGGSSGCQFTIHLRTSNGMFIKHLEEEHAFTGQINKASGGVDRRSRTGAEFIDMSCGEFALVVQTWNSIVDIGAEGVKGKKAPPYVRAFLSCKTFALIFENVSGIANSSRPTRMMTEEVLFTHNKNVRNDKKQEFAYVLNILGQIWPRH
ncbi:hypothetical protein HYPSUDRAFT_1084887 [Hypholoma sublateritium FD-334 SS-4]|uniref:Uncharacterized protein n=1 Tax=Hypholoma sublateritium (strain FD-334 SS-4) TaxID=945553 RepID=A0A0D2P0R8_HYPSF|nr:hypothetical protein HYPSUDRAFT_1084887 [Hypholoma sublateritium FD-334 SS-4]